MTAGFHTVTFQGTNLNGGDNTVFLDQVSVEVLLGVRIDPGFELPALSAGTFAYNPTGSPWMFSGGAGVSSNQSPFTSGNPDAPQGNQVALIQGMGNISQSVQFAAGAFVIHFEAAQRGNFGVSAQTFQVLVDGTVVGTFNNLSSTAYTQLSTSSFTVTAGFHTVTFQGTNLNGGDNTVFLDQVSVVQPPPTPSLAALPLGVNGNGDSGTPAVAASNSLSVPQNPCDHRTVRDQRVA